MKDTLYGIMMTIRFKKLREFQNDFKRLNSKYSSLPEDFQQFCNVIAAVPLGSSKHFTVITQIGDSRIIKARFFCRYLKGSSLRIVYAYYEKLQWVEFIELYYKGDQENEDRNRIGRYLNCRKYNKPLN